MTPEDLVRFRYEGGEWLMTGGLFVYGSEHFIGCMNDIDRRYWKTYCDTGLKGLEEFRVHSCKL